MKVLLALISFARCGGLLVHAHTTLAVRSNSGTENVANNSMKFVSKIRDDLRRNNDDYAVLEPQNQLAHPAPPARPARLASREPYRNRMLQPAHRLLLTRPQPARSSPPHKFYNDTRRKEDDVDRSYADHNANAFTSYTHSKHYKSMRFNKLKRLLHKEKLQMRQGEQAEVEEAEAEEAEAEEAEAEQAETEQIETEQTETEGTTSATTSPTRPATPPSPPPPLPPSPPPLPPRSPAPHPSYRTVLPPGEYQGPVMRQRKEKSPSPDQIDMAPVRDPQITRIRIKGRLCQRSLMNLEGPSYDKEGKEVMPEYRPKSARSRQFHQTRAPALVLPRCCNCCKKSVLGCQ